MSSPSSPSRPFTFHSSPTNTATKQQQEERGDEAVLPPINTSTPAAVSSSPKQKHGKRKSSIATTNSAALVESWNKNTTLPDSLMTGNNNNNNNHHHHRITLEPLNTTDNFQATTEDTVTLQQGQQIRHHHHQNNSNLIGTKHSSLIGASKRSNNYSSNGQQQHRIRNRIAAMTPQPSSSSHHHQHHHQNKQKINDEEAFRFMSKTPELDPYIREHHRNHHYHNNVNNNNTPVSVSRNLLGGNYKNNNTNNEVDDAIVDSLQQNLPFVVPSKHQSSGVSSQLAPVEDSSVSKMIANSDDFSVDEFYVLRLLVAGDSKSGMGLGGKSAKLSIRLPHVDLAWMRPIFKGGGNGSVHYHQRNKNNANNNSTGDPLSRSEVESILSENGKKNLLTLNLESLANETRDYGQEALHPVFINSPRSAIILLRNGISVTKLMTRPPAFYATDKAGGRRSPDRLLLHLRKQRADEVRKHLVTSVQTQYKRLCESISTAEAVLACCPPKQEDPEIIVEAQLAKEMEQLEKLKNRTTQAVSKNVREERELLEKVAARQQRSELSEFSCREKKAARVESLKEKAERRAEKLRRLKREEQAHEKAVDQQFKEILQQRQEKMMNFKTEQREKQDRKHFEIMRRLRDAQDAHHESETVKKRRLKAKVETKTDKILAIRDEKETELELRKLDYVELDRMRDEIKERAKEHTLDFRRKAAQKVLQDARQADEAELKLARRKNLRKAIGEIEEEKRAEVISRARYIYDNRQSQLESKFSDEQIAMAERALARAEIARLNAADRTVENAERQEAHDMSSQQQAFRKLLAVASLAKKEDAAAVHAQEKKVYNESGQWIRDVARGHFDEQRKKIAEMIRKQHQS